MEFTINIKHQNKIATFLNLIQDIEYIEIVDVKEEPLIELPNEHKVLLEKRLQSIKQGKTSFKSWELVKKKYEIV